MPIFRSLVKFKFLGLAGLLAVVATALQAAPVTFNTALPVAEGEFINRELLVLARPGDDPGGLGRNMEVNTLVSVLAYGVNSKLALFGILPYVDKELSMGSMPTGRGNDGFGDFTLFGRFTFFQQDAPGRTLRVAVFGGTRAPTGEDDEFDNLGRLPPPLQTGTGTWDGFGGVVVTRQSLDYELDGQIAYRNNGKANGFEAGDEWRLDGSLQYRLWPGSLTTTAISGFLYGVLEANLVYRDRNKILGQDEANSGGTILFLAPGLQYVTRRWIVEAVVQYPVIQNPHGTALENGYVVRTGFRWNF